MRKVLNSMLLVSILLVMLISLPANADTRDKYDSYVSAYNAYRNAVIEKKSGAELNQLLDNFKAAKAAYENDVAKGKSNEAQQVIDNANQSSQIQGTTTVDTTSAQVAKKASKLPSTLQRIIHRLWSPRYKNSPDKNIALLNAYIKSEGNQKYADIARYELAKAYEVLKKDPKTANGILQDIAKRNPNSRIGALAKARMKYQVAEQKLKQWRAGIKASYDAKMASYNKYAKTSWLAFPVKAARWVGYVKKLHQFDNNKADFLKFQIWQEKIAAPFVPSIETSFDQFQTATGISSSSAEVRLCYKNSEAWYSRWKLLSEARESIDVQYFIYEEDIFGMSLMGALLKKAKEGLKINLMMDARGTKGFTKKLQGQDYLQELMEYPNVTIKVFNPIHSDLLTVFGNVKRLEASNHDKIFIVDGEYCVIGGRNISMNYFVDPEDYPSAYRDCDVVIHSREVSEQLHQAFVEEFASLKNYKVSKELFGNIDVVSAPMYAAYEAMFSHLLNETYKAPANADRKFLKGLKKSNEELANYKHLTSYAGFDPFEDAVEAPVKIVDKHSFAGYRNDITDEMVKFIDGSKKEIIMQNPYVVLSERIFNALQRAAKRGVKVMFHTNSPFSTDSLATQAMFYTDWKRIMKDIPNSRIYVFHGKRKLHAKTWVFDSKIGVVGTYNLDYVSEQINSEVVAVVKSAEFAKQLRDGIMSNMAQSKQYKISIDEKGDAKAVVGPDDFKGKNFWLLKLMSHLKSMKTLI